MLGEAQRRGSGPPPRPSTACRAPGSRRCTARSTITRGFAAAPTAGHRHEQSEQPSHDTEPRRASTHLRHVIRPPLCPPARSRGGADRTSRSRGQSTRTRPDPAAAGRSPARSWRATKPTSHGQISTAMRDCRRAFRNTSVGSSTAPPPGQLRDLAQERVVDAQVAKLLGIRYHQARELRSHHAVAPPLGHAHQVDALLAARETGRDTRPGPICSRSMTVRSRLGATTPTWESRKLMNSPLPSTASTTTSPDPVPALDGGQGVAAGAAAQRPARELGPELVEVPPAQPEQRPTWPWRRR